jgi:hypothetical protein
MMQDSPAEFRVANDSEKAIAYDFLEKMILKSRNYGSTRTT